VQCIHMYATGMYSKLFKSVLRYQFLVLVAAHPDIVYLHEKGCEKLWLFFIAKRGLQAKAFG
jgi:hypothetical protein